MYWCAADIGWVTGHTYIVYGPLCNGATSVMYEGAPDYPDKDRWWEIVEDYKVTILYTAPTAIRACIKWGREYPEKHDLSSLRLLGSVGEPINPRAWIWYQQVIGGGRCPIVDTWWQTETGQIMITPLPGITETKPGSATRPFPGIEAAAVVKGDGEIVEEGGGFLTLRRPWPAMARTLYKEPERYVETYWSRWGNDIYVVGDAAKIDEDGYFWIVGRTDDVINVSGHRMSTMEIESALVSHENVAEAAVIGQTDEDTGQAICAFVTCEGGADPPDGFEQELREHVAHEDRQARAPEADHLGRRPAEDALGQDHAPPAQGHRRGPRARRRDHAARPRSDRADPREGRNRNRGLSPYASCDHAHGVTGAEGHGIEEMLGAGLESAALLLGGMADVALVVDRDGRILYTNREVPARPMVGTTLFDHDLGAEAEARMRAALHQVFNSGRPMSVRGRGAGRERRARSGTSAAGARSSATARSWPRSSSRPTSPARAPRATTGRR